MSRFAELKRRNVFRVAAAYLVLSWLLLQVGDVLFEALEVPGWGIKLVLGLLALGFVPVLVFSWAYEITPEGLKKESEVDRSRSITPATGRKLDLVTIALVVLAVGFAVLDRLVIGRDAPATLPAPTTEPQLEPSVAAAEGDNRRSIAVLPFSSFSDDPENAFFASGVHEDILVHLAKIHGLRVISRSSVERYAEARPAIPEIARALRVRHIREGSVRRAGGRVRVSAQLIDATADEHVWAENFDRDLDDVFAIQSEIARHIRRRLEGDLERRRATADFGTPDDQHRGL